MDADVSECAGLGRVIFVADAETKMPRKRGIFNGKIETETLSKLTAADKAPGAKKSKKKLTREPWKDSISAGDTEVSAPTLAQVQLRAYFIAQRRRELGLPGDETSDWVQAERELLPA